MWNGLTLQKCVKHTSDALGLRGEQLDVRSTVALQNRRALDCIMAVKGGVCHMIGDECCTYIPSNTAPRWVPKRSRSNDRVL